MPLINWFQIPPTFVAFGFATDPGPIDETAIADSTPSYRCGYKSFDIALGAPMDILYLDLLFLILSIIVIVGPSY
jgi:hypothetical protein